jgi:NAD(P)-dependent dehydrogenase (short-subunit alcohol dehydrogenase family)
MLPLGQQTVFLTGAAQGLGAAIARHFSAFGANLVLFDRNSAGLARTVSECGGKPRAILVDLTSADETESAVALAISEVSTVDTVIHNAAILTPEPFSELTLETFRATVDVGLQAAFLLTKAVWPGMVERGGGSLIFVSSRSGIEGVAEETAYCAAKHGLEGFSKSIAQAGASHGIVSATVTPGMYMRTPSSEATYTAEERLKWVEPDLLAPAFSLIAERRPKEFSGQRLNAWQLAQTQGAAYELQ